MKHHHYPTHISIDSSNDNTNDSNDDGYDPKAVYSYFPNGDIKTYRPILFRNIRRLISNTDTTTSSVNSISKYNEFDEKIYMQCLHYDNLQCLSSDSKSGQAFWVSKDGSIVLKTIKHYEMKNIVSILTEFHDHLINSKDIGYPSTIASILGLYRVTTKSGKKKYFMACRNVYPNQNICIPLQQSKQKTIKILKKYDLKGSTVGRRASLSSSVKKDLDLIESGNFLSLGEQSKEIIVRSLMRDTEFLSRHSFMDYSLLVAEVKEETYSYVNNSTSEKPNNRRGIRRLFSNIFHRHKEIRKSSTSYISKTPNSVIIDSSGIIVLKGDNDKIYYFGIIDFLQKYSFRKVMETWIKGFYSNSKKISCVHPKYYAERFIEFLHKFIV
jgi:1-phosphatidylinositol-4-phosphate 5-kinase